MKLIAIKTEDGAIKGKISFYCRILHVTRQGFYKYLTIKKRPWKYQPLADAMFTINAEDECNDTYGRIRMYQALKLKKPEGVTVPNERTVYRVMEKIGLSHRPRRTPNGITKVDREARKSEDLLKRDFRSDEPLTKCVTDITEIKAADGKLYVSSIFDCFDSAVLGLAMDTNMKASLYVKTLDNAVLAYPELRGAIIHSDRGTQYTSQAYRDAISHNGIRQSMNSADGRCHDNARCESMWARMKSELLYDRYEPEKMPVEDLKVLIWRYFLSYWNNRRLCPPAAPHVFTVRYDFPSPDLAPLYTFYWSVRLRYGDIVRRKLVDRPRFYRPYYLRQRGFFNLRHEFIKLREITIHFSHRVSPDSPERSPDDRCIPQALRKP